RAPGMRTHLVALTFLMTALTAACADDSVPGLEGADDIDPQAAVAVGKADSLTTTATYYNVVRDTRRCASPMCGGYFVSRVNRTWTLCNDGGWRNACYVSSIDFQGGMGMTDDEASAVAGGIDQKRVLLRGAVKTQTVAGHKVGGFTPS